MLQCKADERGESGDVSGATVNSWKERLPEILYKVAMLQIHEKLMRLVVFLVSSS